MSGPWTATKGERDVLVERAKQREEYSDRHDDQEHRDEALARAASYLVNPGPMRREPHWADELWTKLGTRRSRLVAGAALLIAEIDRLDREAERAARPLVPPG